MELASKNLLKAAESGHCEKALSALESEANPNWSNERGETPLMLLCSSDRDSKYFSFNYDSEDSDYEYDDDEEIEPSPIVRVLEKLLSCGVNISATNIEKQNALHYAACSTGSQSLRWLLRKGCPDINGQDLDGNTRLHGREGAVPVDCYNKCVLLIYGCSPLIRNNNGELPDLDPHSDYDGMDHICPLEEFYKKFKVLETGIQVTQVKIYESDMRMYLAEWRKMKTFKFHQHATLYDVLFFKNRIFISRLARNEMLVKFYTDNKFCLLEQFPQFGMFLNAIIDKAFLRNESYKKFEIKLNYILETQIPSDILDNIFQYFSNSEIAMLSTFDYVAYLSSRKICDDC